MALEAPDAGGPAGGPGGPIVFPPATGPSATVVLGFNGISQVDVRNIHSGFSEIPPDTMGAIGPTQFMETSNGAYAVYDKTTGATLSLIGDGTFWNNAGQPTPPPPAVGVAPFSNGDSRVLFDQTSGRWIVESFAASVGSIQIAVSDTSNALGPWKSTSFAVFNPGPFGGISDYPTLAIDSKAVYIGTNDFQCNNAICSSASFKGTTLNVINRNDLFGGVLSPAITPKQFFTPFLNNPASQDSGFAIQGVNQLDNSDSGRIAAISIYNFGLLRYDINNPGTPGATQTPSVLIDPGSAYDANSFARQPFTQAPACCNGAPFFNRTIDPLDDRVSSAVWELNGKIYAVHTITPSGSDHTAIEWNIIDAATNKLIQKGIIGNDGIHDFYQGTITVNKNGQVVIGYNRSGFDAAGKVRIYADTFNPDRHANDGSIIDTGSYLLFESPIDDYHNGSAQFSAPAGRQRWGDYAQVTVDPNNPESFWAIGEYALGYLPSQTASNSRWGTWINDLILAPVPTPEPVTLTLFGAGLLGLGALGRRRKKSD